MHDVLCIEVCSSIFGFKDSWMPRFRVTVTGKNILMRVEDVIGKYEFLVSVFVDAPDTRTARRVAIDAVWEAKKLKFVCRNEGRDPPQFDAEEVELAGFQEGGQARVLGMAWYPAVEKGESDS